MNPGLLLVTCDQELDLVTLSVTSQADGPVLEGIGFVPFDWITPAGLADTTDQDPSYFYQVQNAPFGGSLPVMLLRACERRGAAGYQVYVDGAVRTDQFNTAKWDGTQYQPVVISTMTIGGVADSYPVPSLTDLGLYIQSLPGCYLDSTTLSDGTLHTIEVSFFDGSGNLLETSPGLSILVDNRPCSVTLDQAAIGGTSATERVRLPAVQPGDGRDRPTDHRLHGHPTGRLRHLGILGHQVRWLALPSAGGLPAPGLPGAGEPTCSVPAPSPPTRRRSGHRRPR